MQKQFINVTVEVNDPEDRLVSGEEITVQLVHNVQDNTFLITVPEAKKPEKKDDKPKPTNVYTGVLTNVKGTISVKGSAKLSLDIKPAMVKALGVKTVKAEVDEALMTVLGAVSPI